MADAKEYLRRVFNNGALDVTRDYLTVLEFVRLFKGEREARIAIDQCAFLDPREKAVLERYA